jgi:outer membrane immunogenic protein
MAANLRIAATSEGLLMMVMKRIALGALSVFVLAGAASAADMPLKAPYVAPPPAFSWTGCYVGGNVGGIKNDSRLTSSPSGDYLPILTPAQLAGDTYTYDATGTAVTAGANWGCNRQYGSIVLGLDSDFNWTGINESINANHPLNVPVGLQTYTEAITQKLTYFSTTRARLGWAHDRFMVFVAGGLASGKVKSDYLATFPTATYSGSENKTRYGWTIGGGAEYALSQNWFLRGEYLYIDLGKFDYTNLQTPGPSGFTWNTEVETKAHIARLALTYRFTRAGSMLEWAMGGFKY